MSKKIPIMLGAVDLEAVVDEAPSTTGDTTDKPVEKGSNISDHYKSNPATISLQGSVVEGDAPRKLSMLKKYQRDSQLLKYVGRNVLTNMQIVSFNTRHNVNNRGGFDFDIGLKQVFLSTPETFEVGKVNNPVTRKPDKKVETKVKAETNKGSQQPKLSKSSISDYNKMMMEDKLAVYNSKAHAGSGGVF